MWAETSTQTGTHTLIYIYTHTYTHTHTHTHIHTHTHKKRDTQKQIWLTIARSTIVLLLVQRIYLSLWAPWITFVIIMFKKLTNMCRNEKEKRREELMEKLKAFKWKQLLFILFYTILFYFVLFLIVLILLLLLIIRMVSLSHHHSSPILNSSHWQRYRVMYSLKLLWAMNETAIDHHCYYLFGYHPSYC